MIINYPWAFHTYASIEGKVSSIFYFRELGKADFHGTLKANCLTVPVLVLKSPHPGKTHSLDKQTVSCIIPEGHPDAPGHGQETPGQFHPALGKQSLCARLCAGSPW